LVTTSTTILTSWKVKARQKSKNKANHQESSKSGDWFENTVKAICGFADDFKIYQHFN
jgi:hypothetical protein